MKVKNYLYLYLLSIIITGNILNASTLSQSSQDVYTSSISSEDGNIIPNHSLIHHSSFDDTNQYDDYAESIYSILLTDQDDANIIQCIFPSTLNTFETFNAIYDLFKIGLPTDFVTELLILEPLTISLTNMIKEPLITECVDNPTALISEAHPIITSAIESVTPEVSTENVITPVEVISNQLSAEIEKN